MIYIAVLCNLRITAEPLYDTPLFIGPYAAPSQGTKLYCLVNRGTLGVCEQLAQGCCPNNAAVGVEPATS